MGLSFCRLKKPTTTQKNISVLFWFRLQSFCLYLVAIIQLQLTADVGKRRNFEQSINRRIHICFVTVKIVWIGEKKELREVLDISFIIIYTLLINVLGNYIFLSTLL